MHCSDMKPYRRHPKRRQSKTQELEIPVAQLINELTRWGKNSVFCLVLSQVAGDENYDSLNVIGIDGTTLTMHKITTVHNSTETCVFPYLIVVMLSRIL